MKYNLPEIKPRKIENFEPAKQSAKIQFINFGSEGEPFIIHIEDWGVYELPALKKEWRKTLFILDVDGRGIKINAIGFQILLKPFWNQKSSLVVRRFIPKNEDGTLLTSGTTYKVNQFNSAKLWDYQDLSPENEEITSDMLK